MNRDAGLFRSGPNVTFAGSIAETFPEFDSRVISAMAAENDVVTAGRAAAIRERCEDAADWGCNWSDCEYGCKVGAHIPSCEYGQ